jgi:catechol 2,3-dioxygenase-like lactoylglutathione lyase family enzyme
MVKTKINTTPFNSRDFSAIFDHVSIGVCNINISLNFYRACLGALGMKVVMDKGFAVAFGNGIGRQWLWVSEPIDKNLEVKVNNGAHFAFIAHDRKTVRSFYKEAIANGGIDAGAPGLRPEYMATYYGAFVFDPDGNKVEAVCRKDEDE